jgi:methylated-DNA-[protein]-cysteine S-methyltransferase
VKIFDLIIKISMISAMDYWDVFKTSLGWCGLIRRGSCLKEVILPVEDKRYLLRRIKQGYPSAQRSHPRLNRFIEPLKEYFEGRRADLRVPVGLDGCTEFEKSVYRVLRRVKFGSVRSYGWIAERLKNKKSARAVGNALAKNPVPIVIPCHRIIRSDNSPGNFSAREGSKLKQKLLALEGVTL